MNIRIIVAQTLIIPTRFGEKKLEERLFSPAFMPIEKWQKIKTERAFDGFTKIDLTTFRLPDGKDKVFDIKTTGHDVISVVGITKDKQFVLTEQFRPGPEKIFYEFVLGLIEAEEKPIEAAKREFLEETGYTGEFKNTGVVKYLSAYNTTAIHCFVATDCYKVTDKLVLDEGEFIEVHLFSLSEVRQMLKTGQIRNFSEGYLALDHLGLL